MPLTGTWAEKDRHMCDFYLCHVRFLQLWLAFGNSQHVFTE